MPLDLPGDVASVQYPRLFFDVCGRYMTISIVMSSSSNQILLRSDMTRTMHPVPEISVSCA